MNKLTFSTALVMALSTTAAFAHHPLTEINDELSATVTENLEAADSPHLDMDMDTMGSAMDVAVGEASGPQAEMTGMEMDVDVAADTASTLDTMVLMESVTGAME